MVACIATLILPLGDDEAIAVHERDLHVTLKEKYGIQVPVWSWPPCGRYFRISAQLYNSEEEYRYLAWALNKNSLEDVNGWIRWRWGNSLPCSPSGSSRPGPTLTRFAHSGMFGPKANVKLIAGVIGFVAELTVGLLVDAVSDSATAMTVLHWIGMIFLGAMVIAMFRFDPASVAVSDHIEGMLGIKVGIGMQFVNGKEWAFVIIMMSQFIEPLGGGMTGIATIIFTTLTMCLGAMILWTVVALDSTTSSRRGNRKAHLPGLRLCLACWRGLPRSRPAVPSA